MLFIVAFTQRTAKAIVKARSRPHHHHHHHHPDIVIEVVLGLGGFNFKDAGRSLVW